MTTLERRHHLLAEMYDGAIGLAVMEIDEEKRLAFLEKERKVLNACRPRLAESLESLERRGMVPGARVIIPHNGEDFTVTLGDYSV